MLSAYNRRVRQKIVRRIRRLEIVAANPKPSPEIQKVIGKVASCLQHLVPRGGKVTQKFVRTRKGDRWLIKAPADHIFWDIWGTHKSEMKALGFSASKVFGDYDDFWEINFWIDPEKLPDMQKLDKWMKIIKKEWKTQHPDVTVSDLNGFLDLALYQDKLDILTWFKKHDIDIEKNHRDLHRKLSKFFHDAGGHFAKHTIDILSPLLQTTR